MIRVLMSVALAVVATAPAVGQSSTPGQAALSFYTALREKRYVEGFRHSVYRGAVEKLTAAELAELEPDFSKTFSAIPAKIDIKSEKVTGETALVMLQFAGSEDAQPVGLIRVGHDWLVGDQETLNVVKEQGNAFFFNSRMLVNEGEVADTLTRIVGAEYIYSKNFEGRNLSLAELVKKEGVPKDLEDEESSGYKFVLTLSADTKTYSVTATPLVYGKSGRISFYADAQGIRGEDRKGQPASITSPMYQQK